MDEIWATQFNNQIKLENLERDEEGFKNLTYLMHKISGVSLPDNKKNRTLVASRLRKILIKKNKTTLMGYWSFLRKATQQDINEFVSALTTNTTSFFRENIHFKALKGYVEKILEDSNENYEREIRIWCAGSSTGQEAYSLAMHLVDLIDKTRNFSLKILATDIDHKILEIANQGVYSGQLVKEMPPHLKGSYFSHTKDGSYRVKDEIRNKIRFAYFNLREEVYPFQQSFDFIFCRNVLIYFEKNEAQEVINKMIQFLKPGGRLFLGSSEAGLTHKLKLKSVATTVYEKTG